LRGLRVARAIFVKMTADQRMYPLGLAGAADDDNGGGCIGHIANSSARIDMAQELAHTSGRLKGASSMEKVSLTALAREHLETARAASSGRSSHTVYGGHEHSLRQTLMALTAGSKLDDHESPGEATLQVLQGRVRVTISSAGWDGSPGDHIILPRERHGLNAIEDSVVLLTVSKPIGPHT
jgi:quercetin dioxygenase-like cupin family protein